MRIIALKSWFSPLRDRGKTGTMGLVDGSLMPLEERVLDSMRAQGLVSPGDTVLVAVSGGADSMALLLILCAVQAQVPLSVHVAHYEHGIRGEASLQDAAFVQVFCQEWGIPFHLGRGDVPALAALERRSLEDAARKARYAFLEETAARIGADRIALAHQQEDQAETLLLHLVHGSGLQGMAGMRPRRQNRIRPLLDIPRAELEAYLRAKGVTWREDETNADTAYARNVIRREVLPRLARLNPRVAEAMARAAGHAAEAYDELVQVARAQLSGRTKRLPYGAFLDLTGQVPMKEALRLFCRDAGVPELDAEQTGGLAQLAPGGMLNLPGGWRAYRSRTRLHLLDPMPVAPQLALDDFVQTPANPLETGDGIRTQVLDASLVAEATFRFRQDGDTFAPIGMEGTQKLKHTLQAAGIDRPFRDLLPVLAIGSRVLWIVGIKAGRDAAITANTHRAVRIDYHGDLPWEIIWRDNT